MLASAYTRRPVRAPLATAASMVLKFGWSELVAPQYDEARVAEFAVAVSTELGRQDQSSSE